jgi:hypothetical protein
LKTIQPILIFLLLGSLFLFAQPAENDTTSRKSSAESKKQIDAAALEAELAKELGVEADSSTTGGQTQPALGGSQARQSGVLNPKISAIGTFLASGTENHAVVKPVNLGLPEAELSLQAYVDPYARADFYLAFHTEGEDPFSGPDSVAAANSEYQAHLEEAYLTTLSLPYGLQLKAGKFRLNFGRINQVHPHALSYVDVPRMYVNFLGEEGLADGGVAINWLVPNSIFYQELNFEITSGAVEGPSFEGGSKDLLYTAHLKNFFDLNDNTTLELGFSGVQGSNNPAGDKTTIGGADLTLIWKPLRYNRYKSFEWTSEGLVSKRRMPGASVTSYALYSFMRYQIGHRWFVGARYDYSQFPDNSEVNEAAYSGILSFFATEFQKIDLQYQYGVPAEGKNFNRVLLRAVFVIGAHGAHKY